MEQITSERDGCRICPRECNVSRLTGQRGFCRAAGPHIYVARAALHMWEEPCISGEKGSGTVFFSGCCLRCVYCQNYRIAHELRGRAVSAEQLADIFLKLQNEGAANINLVTPTHYTPQIIMALESARADGLHLPIVYNCSGYEKVETLKSLEGLADIYLTDFKYMDAQIAAQYSRARDYPQVAGDALKEMVRQQPEAVFAEDGMMERGVIVRHLLLPGHLKNAMAVVKYVYETYGDQVYLSLMNQYTPVMQTEQWPNLRRRVTKREYDRLVEYALSLGVERGFIQDGETAKESFIPDFEEPLILGSQS